MRNNTSNDSRNEIPESPIAIGNVGTPIPVQYQQLVSDVPSGTKSDVTPSYLKLTEESTSKQLKRTSTYASYFLNVPLDNALITVASIAKVIKNMAETYDRQHQDSFFQAWPDLILRSPDQEEEFSTAYLRTHIKMFARRLAHYYYEYVCYRKYWIASLINLVNLAKLQGDGPIKRFSDACKWGYINTNTNMFSRFCDPIGFTDGMCDVAKHAVGKTNYGSDILALPFINVDIWGNRGYHSLPIDNVIATAGGDGTEGSSLSSDGNSVEKVAARTLIHNMGVIINEYANMNLVSISSQKQTRHWAPYMPRIENGPRMNVITYDEHGDPDLYQSYFMNEENLRDVYANVFEDCPLASIFWNNYKYWEKLTIDNFPEMMDPNSDIRVFAMTQLHYVVESKTVQDIYNNVYNAKNVDMNEIIKMMCLKKDNKVNTATIVRWAPLIGGARGTARSDNFAINFERYDVFNTNVAQMLSKSKTIPDLTPTSFAIASEDVETTGGTPCYPIIVNSCPAMADELMPKAGQNYPQQTSSPGIYGKYASYFDQASSVSLDPTVTNIVTHGVQKDWIESYVKSGNGVVFEEDPTTVRALSNPVFETNDLFMAGFNLLVFNEADNVAASDTTKFFRDPSNFPGVEDTPVADEDYIEAAFVIGNNEKVRMHTANKKYLDKIKTAFIFLGEGIFNHPIINPSIKGCGTPVYTLFGGGNEEQTPYRNTKIIADLSSSAVTGFISDLSEIITRGTEQESDLQQTTGLTLVGSAPKSILLMHFDPNYGPIKPVTYGDSVADIVPVDIFGGKYNYVNVNTKVQVQMMHEYIAAENYDPEAISLKPLYMNTRSINKMILPCITSFNIMPCTVDDSGVAILAADKPPKAIWCSGVWDYMRSLLTKVLTQFTGIEDTMPFWSHPLVQKVTTAIEIPAVSEFNASPKQEIQVAPRVPNSRMLNRKSSFNDFRAKPDSLRSESQSAATMLGGKPEKSHDGRSFNSNKKRVRHGRRHPKAEESYTKTTDSDGVLKDSNFGTSSVSVPSLANSSDIKAEFEFKKGKKTDESQIMKGIQA